MIPPFNEFGVLPAKVGDTAKDHSPYFATMAELAARYGFSQERREILGRLIRFRSALAEFGFRGGGNLLGGSFLDDCETRDGGSPQDLDVLTVLRGPPRTPAPDLQVDFRTRFSRDAIKRQYGLVGWAVVAEWSPPLFVTKMVAAGTQLLTNDRFGGSRGLLLVRLNLEDDAATSALLQANRAGRVNSTPESSA